MRSKKITLLLQLYVLLPNGQQIILDVIRQIVLENLPAYCKEKISFNVPYFYGRTRICIIWPAAIPRGGIKEGVLLGFWYGNRLYDSSNYLLHGNNKQIFYKIYNDVADIDPSPIIELIKDAVWIDGMHN